MDKLEIVVALAIARIRAAPVGSISPRPDEVATFANETAGLILALINAKKE